jgi:hypothetical protein
VHWRIRARSARPDNRQKESPTASPGRSQVEPYQRIARLRADQGRQAGHRRFGPHNIGWPDEVNTALTEFLISQPGGTCRQSATSPDICLRHYPGLILPASSTEPDPAEGGAMEPPATGYDAIDHTQSSVHDWRVSQLTRLGIPGPLAEVYADRIDWHQIARLVCHGCPPRLALRIIC